LATRGTSPAPSFVPPDLSDLALWLDATVDGQMFNAASGGTTPDDGSQTLRWQDISGLNRHMTSTFGPLLDVDGGPDGGRALVFSGVSAESFLGLTTDITTGAAMTVYMVVSVTSHDTGKLLFDTNSTGARVGLRTSGLTNGLRSIGLTPSRGVIPPINEYVVLSVRANTNYWGVRFNGVSERVSTAAFAPSNARFWLGATANTIANVSNMPMRLVGVVAADGFHDDATQAKVMKYLRNHHEAEPTKVNLICDGNSLTFGTGSTAGNDYPSQLRDLLGSGYWVTNVGVGGKNTASMISGGAETVDTRQDSWNPRNWLIAWEGTNQLVISTAQAAYDLMVQYCQERRAAGADKIIVGTMLPAEFTTEEKRQQYNTLIRTNWASFADAMADVGDDSTIGQEGDNLNLTYYTDETHMTDAGYAIVAGIFEDAVNSLT
jgi:lysophospholipase L1-like esterase